MDKTLQDLFYQYNEDMYKINEMKITTDKKMAEDFITYTKNKMKSFKTHNHKIYIEKSYNSGTNEYSFDVYVNNADIEEIYYNVQYDHNFPIIAFLDYVSSLLNTDTNETWMKYLPDITNLN